MDGLRTDDELVLLVSDFLLNPNDGWMHNMPFTVNDIKDPKPRVIQDVYGFLIKQILQDNVTAEKKRDISAQLETQQDLPLIYLFRTMRDLLSDMNYAANFSISYLTKPTPSTVRDMLVALTNCLLVVDEIWGENHESEDKAAELSNKHSQLMVEKEELKTKIAHAIKEETETKLREEEFVQNIASLRPRIEKLSKSKAEADALLASKKDALKTLEIEVDKKKRLLQQAAKEEGQTAACVVKDPESLPMRKLELENKLQELNETIQMHNTHMPRNDELLGKLKQKIANWEIVTMKLDDCKSTLAKQKTISDELFVKHGNYQRLLKEEEILSKALAAAEQKVAYLEREIVQYKASYSEKVRNHQRLEQEREKQMSDLESKLFKEEEAKRQIEEQKKKLRERQTAAEELEKQYAATIKEIDEKWTQKIHSLQEEISKNLNEVFAGMDQDNEMLDDFIRRLQ